MLFEPQSGAASSDPQPQLENLSIKNDAAVASAEPTFAIRVHDPDRKGDGMNAYITFRVSTKSTLPALRGLTPSVERRYSDFLWLHDQLVEEYKSSIVPPLPEKNSLSFNRFSPEFIEQRRKELERFLKRVADHSVLSSSPDFLAFLEAGEEKLQSIKSKGVSAAELKANSIAASVFSFFGNTVNKVVGTAFEETDPWYQERLDYVTVLEAQLTNLARSSGALSRKYKELSENYVDFAKASSLLGDAESDYDKETSNAFMRISGIAIPVATLHKDLADQELVQFEESIRDYSRIVAAVKRVLVHRSELGAAIQGQAKEIEEKRERLKTATSTARLSKEIEDDEAAKAKKVEEFDQVSRTARQEFERFEVTKAKEIREAVTKLIQFNMNLELQIVDMWKKFLAMYQKDA